MYTRSHLLPRIHSLCSAFASHAPLPALLSNFTTTNPPPLIHEHGLRTLAPFVGRDFTGRDGITEYFTLLAQLLRFEEMRFDPEDEWVVDAHCLAVSVRGRAMFIWIETGEAWEETFVYRIRLAEDQGKGRGQGQEEEGGLGLKVCEYLVWADTGAAYLARKGELSRIQGPS